MPRAEALGVFSWASASRLSLYSLLHGENPIGAALLACLT